MVRVKMTGDETSIQAAHAVTDQHKRLAGGLFEKPRNRDGSFFHRPRGGDTRGQNRNALARQRCLDPAEIGQWSPPYEAEETVQQDGYGIARSSHGTW